MAPSELKELLRTRFDEDPEPGVLAFRGGQAVGSCAVEPRHRGSYGKVRIMGPSAVIATVCSLCRPCFRWRSAESTHRHRGNSRPYLQG